MNSFKTLAVSILNTIHDKLKTKEGQLTLIIVASLITGASIVTIHLKGERIEELTADRKEKMAELQLEAAEIKILRQEIKEADRNCNEKILEGARFQRELKTIFEGKIEANTEIANAKLPLLKEKAEAIKTQKKNVQELKQLNAKL